MSEHKKQSMVVVGGKGAVLKHRKPHAVHWKLGTLIVAAVVVLAGLVVGVYLLTRSGGKQPTPATTANPKVTVSRAELVRNTADNGNYVAAKNQALAQASTASTPTDKASWYTQAYSLALDQGDYKAALSYAQQANTTQPTSATAYNIAQVYEKLEDNANAKKYLQLAIGRLSKTDEAYYIKSNQYKTEMAGLR